MGGFIQRVRFEAPAEDAAAYPFSLPVVNALVGSADLALDPAVTFIVGENGSGQSTLVESIAVTRPFRFN